MIKLWFFILGLFLFNFPIVYSQPKNVIAECFTSSHESVKLIHISSELDVYKFVSEKSVLNHAGKYWDILLNNDFIVDYSYSFGREIKTESRGKYYLLLKPIDSKSIEVRIHLAHGSKTLVKIIDCDSN
jgi:hypothetical protein